MKLSKSSGVSVINIFSTTIKTIKKNPSIYAPFAVFALLEFIALIIVFLAPRAPLNLVLGPPIKTLWGEKFLHYPANFLLLPKLASHTRLFLSIFAGSLLTGLAVALAYRKSINTVYKKYIVLLLLIVIISALLYFFTKIITVLLVKYFSSGHKSLLFLSARAWLGPVSLIINLLFTLFVQSAFVYAIPALIIGEGKILKMIGKSFVFFKKHFIATLLLIGLPMLIYVPMVILNYNATLLIYKFFPEIILYIALLGIVISSLVIDPLITIATALFYLEKRVS